MKRFYFVLMLCTAISICMSAQIGYQVSLLNNATGEPRANERVTITVKITDNDGNPVCEETKTETSNDFGVISMSVGDDKTFLNADWRKLPFFIEASVDGRLLGRSQLLSVPVAEHAKHTGTLSKDVLCAKPWKLYDENGVEQSYSFSLDGSVIWTKLKYDYDIGGYKNINHSGVYEVNGNSISIIIPEEEYACRMGMYNHVRHTLMIINRDYIWPFVQD